MSNYDIVIKGGTVFDGLQTPRFKADIAVKDGRIAQIGNVDASEGAEVVDASGKHVAPGFVDLHTHYDSQVFWDPWCTMSGWHGVTSVVIGNCGFGFAPCKPEDRDRTMLSLSRNEAVPLRTMQAGMPWDWVTFPEFLESVDRTPKGVNVMAFVPLAPLYGYIADIDLVKASRVTDEQLAEMSGLLIEAMEAGGCGWSAQVSGEIGNVQLDHDGTPMVTDFMGEREVAAFSRALRSVGRGVIQLTGSLDVAALMARESGRPIIWNALLADGALNQHGGSAYTHKDAIKQLTYYNEEEGLRIYAQALTTNFVSEFTFEDYNLLDTLPCWKEALLGTVEEKQVKLADPERRKAMKELDDVRGGLFGAGYVTKEIKVNWISSDAPQRTGDQGEVRGLHHRRDRRPRGQAPGRRHAGHRLCREPEGRLRDEVDRDPARVDEGDRQLAGGPPRSERRGGAHEVRHHGPLSHGAHQLLGPRTRDHVAGGGPLAAFVVPGPRRRAEGPGLSARGRPGGHHHLRLRALSTAGRRSGCGTTPEVRCAWCRRRRATSASSSTA